MKFIPILFLALWFPVAAFSGGLGDPTPPSTRYVELAGKVIKDSSGAFIFKSNGHQYRLSVDPSDPGVDRLKSGMAIIVKGQLTIGDDPQAGTTRTLRPNQLIIWGHAYDYPDPPAP